MRSQLRDAAGLVRNFDDAYAHAVQTLKIFRSRYGYPQIGYVSGSLRGDERDVVIRLTGLLEEAHGFPCFTLQDVFTLETLGQLREAGYTSGHYGDFAREVLRSGYVTHAFFAPGWEESHVAKLEYEAAEQFGISISYIEY